ncbi:MAG: hypothetical protein LQ344_003897 [Seirophora lacunosa]|nr:MAG: hypothetical protein LQ344_003897 [Seirophora lacunosa]
MAGASDKARFYLEQSVPELQELIRKKLLTNEEVRSIAKKRSAFEHKLNARGSTASDYARYAEFEMNLDSLRRKRSRRLGVKATSYTGQRRIFFLLDRATRKFHGDTDLWLQYLTFARQQKANKKVTQIITTMLRLHPTSPELWAYSAAYAMEERGDVTEARSYMQRGLRFCSQSKSLWSEYLKLEMIHIAKILARRHILGLDSNSSERHQASTTEVTDADVIPLSSVRVEKQTGSVNNGINSRGSKAAESKIASTPALNGAIPIAICDSAMKRFPSDATYGAQLFGMVAGFSQLQCTRRILQHIVGTLLTAAPTSPATLDCFISEPVIGISTTSPEFPEALITVLDRFDSTMRKFGSMDDAQDSTRKCASVSRHMITWIMPYLAIPELDPDIRSVLRSMVSSAGNHCLSDMSVEGGNMKAATIALLESLDTHGFKELVQSGLVSALEAWPDEPGLLALQASGLKEPDSLQ